MFPAVGFITEGALELFSHGPGVAATAAAAALAPVHVLLAHLLFEMLLEAGLVGKLPGAVGTLERAVHPVVRRLQVVVEEALLGEVLVAVVADKGPLTGVHAVVHVEMGLARVRFVTDLAHKRLLS